MSSLIVEVCKIESVRPHPNAERLDIAIVKGWQCVVPKGTYCAGSPITYIPPDAVIPRELSDKLGVTKYLSSGRVRAAKLRGEPSFGVVCEPFGAVGEDVAAKLGITKYIPPARITAGDAAPDHPMFARYTDIENLRNFPDILIPGEEVVMTEKIHGTNCRIGMVYDNGWQLMAGSKGLCRARSDDGLYWSPLKIRGVSDLLDSYAYSGTNAKVVVLFGEIYGKVQGLRYGLPTSTAYRAFDLMVDGHYIDYDHFVVECKARGIEMAPEIYRGPFSMDVVKANAGGRSVIPGADNIREGVVIRPTKERHDPKVGRVIMKYVSDEFLCGANDEGTE